jgi:hypothetical protein
MLSIPLRDVCAGDIITNSMNSGVQPGIVKEVIKEEKYTMFEYEDGSSKRVKNGTLYRRYVIVTRGISA